MDEKNTTAMRRDGENREMNEKAMKTTSQMKQSRPKNGMGVTKVESRVK